MHENDKNIIELTDVAENARTPWPVKESPWKDRKGLLWTCALSVLLHLAAYAILVYADVSYPVIAASSDQEVLWFYPSLLLGTMTPLAGNEQPVAENKLSPPSVEQASSSTAEPLPVTGQPTEPTPVPVPAEPAEPAEPEEMEMRTAPAPRPAVEEPPRQVRMPVSPPPATPRMKPHHEALAEKKTVEAPKSAPLPPERLPSTEQPEKPPLQPVVQALAAEKQPVKPIQPVVPAPEPSPRKVVMENEDGSVPLKPREAAEVPAIEKKNETPRPPPPVIPDPPRVIEKAASPAAATQNIVKREQTPPIGPIVKNENKRTQEENPPPVKPSQQARIEKAPAPVPAVLPKQEEKPKQFSTSAAPLKQEAKTVPVATAPVRQPAAPLKQEAKPMPVAAAPVRQPAAPSPGEDAGRIAPAKKAGEATSTAARSAATGKESAPNDATSAKKGLFAPPLPGDLKVELIARQTLARGVKVAMLFRDFPKAKRNRPLSKTESKRMTPVNPKIVAPGGGNAIMAIIEKAGEGVYNVRLELEHEPSLDASIGIKLYEGSPRSRVTNLPIRTLRHNETILRILMPEGILWDDSAAFTGSLESSDSVTRFNIDSGLVWKEYN